MKKLLIILFCLLLLTGCSSGRISRKEPDKIIKMMEEDYSFILLLSREDCSSCIEYKETVEKLVKEYRLTVYNIVIDDYEDENLQNLINNYLYTLSTVPATFIIVNGRVEDRYEGIIEYDDLVEWLKGYGAIS